MKDVNKILLMGRLGADPVQRETKNGLAVVHFPLATSRRIKEEPSAEGGASMGEETQWHRIVVWGKQGENCARYLRKGRPVFIEGMVRSHKYDGKDGGSRMSFEVHADNVIFLQNGGQATRLSGEGQTVLEDQAV